MSRPGSILFACCLFVTACGDDDAEPNTDSERGSRDAGARTADDAGGGPGALANVNTDLPFGVLCDGSPARFYDQQLLERVDCGSGMLAIPTARLESAPRTQSPYDETRCTEPVAEQSADALIECAEIEFWHAYSDGRKAPREEALAYMGEAIERLETLQDGSDALVEGLSRLYQLRGMFYMSIGMENGELQYLLRAEDWAAADFERVAELEPGNFVAAAFDITLDMAMAQIAGEDARAVELAREALKTGLEAGDPDKIEPVNVGSIFAVTGSTMVLPLATGVPEETLQAQLDVGCIPEVEFCVGNTDHAPYARPGLEYHLAELYARVGKRDEYIEQLEVVTTQPGYAEWAWKDLVEAQREDPDLLLEKFASYGEDQYSDGYATRNNGCVICHGRI